MPYAKRGNLPGFPREFVFETREQVDHYLSGDRVTCLQCGRAFRILETHLRAVHNMSGDEYRERYGLPYRRGLCAADFSDQRAEHGRTLYAENVERQSAALTKAKAVQEEHGNPQRNKPTFWKKERTKFARETYEEFASRVASGRPAFSVQQDDDMPTTAHVYWYMKRDKDFAVKFGPIVAPRSAIVPSPTPHRQGGEE